MINFEPLINVLLSTVLPALVTVIGALLVAVLRKYLLKIGVELTVAQQEQVKAAVRDAILVVEESSHRDPLSPTEKTILATEILATTLPKVPEAEIKPLIDAQLPLMRVVLGKLPS